MEHVESAVVVDSIQRLGHRQVQVFAFLSGQLPLSRFLLNVARSLHQNVKLTLFLAERHESLEDVCFETLGSGVVHMEE